MKQLKFSSVVVFKTTDFSTWAIFFHTYAHAPYKQLDRWVMGWRKWRKGSSKSEGKLLLCFATRSRAQTGLVSQGYHLASQHLQLAFSKWTNGQVFGLGLFLSDLMVPPHFCRSGAVAHFARPRRQAWLVSTQAIYSLLARSPPYRAYSRQAQRHSEQRRKGGSWCLVFPTHRFMHHDCVEFQLSKWGDYFLLFAILRIK